MRRNNSTTDHFYDKQKEKSRVKTLIVTEFCKAYFPIISAVFTSKDIWYIDLFCGPGRYEDGTPSTPIKLLDVINGFNNDAVRNRLRIVFNDENTEYIEKLKVNISSHPVLAKLKYKPIITNQRASDVDLSAYMRGMAPAFSFIDPWGYKDVSASKIWDLVKNAGSDCVLFFNADRILKDLSKTANEQDFRQIFGDYFSEAKETQISPTLSQRKKAERFLSLFSKNLYQKVRFEYKGKVHLFILPFYVEADDKEKTSHYIVFISKSHKAIREMRRVMIKQSNSNYGQLGFAIKDEMQISLLSREDGADKIIFEEIKKMFTHFPLLYKKEFTVVKLSELLDRYEMSTNFRVFPYSHQEIKAVIKELHKKGYIKIIPSSGNQVKGSITENSVFYIIRKFEDK